MKGEPVHIIQVSDIHFYTDTDKELLGVNTLLSFQAVLDHIANKKHKFDFFIITGDITQDGSAVAYRRVAEIMNDFNKPVYYIPGNHDDVSVMDTVYPTGHFLPDKQIILNGWQLILLDSHIDRKVEGYLKKSQLDFMEACLRSQPALRSIVMFHHQPVKVGAAWLDNLGVQNADEFWQIAEQYDNLHTVIFGHVHQEHYQKHGKIDCYSPPSTCIQFKRHQDEFGLERLPPGYRIITLYPDGRLETHIERVDHYVGVFDENAKGY